MGVKRQFCVLPVYFHLSERKDLVTEFCTMIKINDAAYQRLVDELEMGTEIQGIHAVSAWISEGPARKY